MTTKQAADREQKLQSAYEQFLRAPLLPVEANKPVERNARVAEPLRSILNSFSPLVGRS